MERGEEWNRNGSENIWAGISSEQRFSETATQFLNTIQWDFHKKKEWINSVGEIIIEYHHLPGLPRTLHEILALLHRNGFEYLVSDFDAGVNPATQPPFRIGAETRYFLLIYARRSR
jgi:hypothetical protein